MQNNIYKPLNPDSKPELSEAAIKSNIDYWASVSKSTFAQYTEAYENEFSAIMQLEKFQKCRTI